MKVFKTILIGILTAAFVYCGFAFFLWNFDPSTWPEGARSGFLFWAVVGGGYTLLMRFILSES